MKEYSPEEILFLDKLINCEKMRNIAVNAAKAGGAVPTSITYIDFDREPAEKEREHALSIETDDKDKRYLFPRIPIA